MGSLAGWLAFPLLFALAGRLGCARARELNTGSRARLCVTCVPWPLTCKITPGVVVSMLLWRSFLAA